LKAELFSGENGYLDLKADDIKSAIRNNAEVKQFLDAYAEAFADFGKYMDEALIDDAETLSIAKTEELVASNIFKRFEDVALLDPYSAYELFEAKFTEISGDLEIIQTEGMSAVKIVDPNMVIKKKNGKDAEVQEGWKGHVLPFELVQNICLPEQKAELKNMQEKLAEIPSSYDELLESLSEEDKETVSDALNETNDAFVIKNIKGMIKILKADASTDTRLIEILRKAEELNTTEKNLKVKIKENDEVLHLETKRVIENLSDEQVYMLLHEKWTSPVITGIMKLSSEMLDEFTKNIENLSSKYAITMSDLEKEIHETEISLSKMLSELTGSAADMKGIEELQLLLGGAVNE